ncbi:DUF3558 domain-containing protein [Streptomyces sp. NPDC002004]
MQRKVYLPGAAALLAALLAGCTGTSDAGDEAPDSKAGEAGVSAPAAAPGKYRTLPEPCGEVDHGSLDKMLPGIKEITDPDQREKTYEGTAEVTYDTDRRVGCNWKVESADATRHLSIDFERVVSYDPAVSDAARASEVFASKGTAAGLSEPTPGRSGSTTPSGSASGSPTASPAKDGAKDGAKDTKGPSAKNAAKISADQGSAKSGPALANSSDTPDTSDSPNPSGSAGSSGSSDGADSSDPSDDGVPPDSLAPRTLNGLGDAAFLDDRLATSASAARHRTVTVVFRTSNVIVTIEYDEQPAHTTDVPDSKEMQDRARELAGTLADEIGD